MSRDPGGPRADEGPEATVEPAMPPMPPGTAATEGSGASTAGAVEPAAETAATRRRARDTDLGSGHALEAPHRRQARGPRLREKPVVLAYRALSWLVGHVPPRLAWVVGGWLAMAGYALWPQKRRWARANFGHVLGVSPDDPAAGRLARAAFRNYARYVVELFRLPSLPHEAAASFLEVHGAAEVEAIMRESHGVIFAVAHLGNNEAAAAGLASRGLPISVVADDTAYGELYELLRQQRAAWGVQLIPWRNLRAVYSVLRRGEILGLLVDWGYRPDGIPVRLFGAWTTLPAGPAVLAARNRSTIVPVTVRRRKDGRFDLLPDRPIRVTSTDPAEIARATQAVADALERAIVAAPEQWYTFKPMWPETADEAARLERLAASQTRASSPQPASGG